MMTPFPVQVYQGAHAVMPRPKTQTSDRLPWSDLLSVEPSRRSSPSPPPASLSVCERDGQPVRCCLVMLSCGCIPNSTHTVLHSFANPEDCALPYALGSASIPPRNEEPLGLRPSHCLQSLRPAALVCHAPLKLCIQTRLWHEAHRLSFSIEE